MVILDAQKIREDFPLLCAGNHQNKDGTESNIVYLDSAATSQKPRSVLSAMNAFYEHDNANAHRGMYSLAQRSTQMYHDARRTVAKFIGAKHSEIVFTRSTTDSLNMLASTLPAILEKGRTEIVVTAFEHHANLVPWQQMAVKHNMILKIIPFTESYDLDYNVAEKLISNKTAILAFPHISNALGTCIDAKRLCKLARENGAISVVDGAQSAGHIAINVIDIGCDFFAFSGHKVLGPLGIGVLYGKDFFLESLPPYQTGGDMITEVTYESASWQKPPLKFEAGTPNVAGAVGLRAGLDYISKIGISAIEKHEQHLRAYALKGLSEKKYVKLYTPHQGSGIISFEIKGAHPHDVGSLLADANICVRAGHHCAMPLMNALDVPGTVRISFHIYNTQEDIDKLLTRLDSVVNILGLKNE